MSQKNMWEIEEACKGGGYRCICGVDEAGRGPLAGPVCAAAVVLPFGCEIPGLDDSKKLSDKRRRELFPIIQEKALGYAIAFAHHKEIDDLNILQATFLAMERALRALPCQPDIALIDGNRSRDFGVETQTVVHGDSLSASVGGRLIEAVDPEYGYGMVGYAMYNGGRCAFGDLGVEEL